jgi:putative transcriptional regulator
LSGAPLAERLINRLREVRERAGLTQAQLANAIGVSRKTVNTVENGVFVPSTLIAIKLAAVLQVPVEALFSVVE